jgi:hypothetical protein
LALTLLVACGSTPPPASPEEPLDSAPPAEAPAEPSAQEEGAAAGGSAEAPAAADAPSSAGPASETEVLARDFLKSGGRRIGYSATKKGFAYPQEQRRPDGFRLDILFTDEDGRKRDVMEVCDFVVCAEGLDEIAKTLVPKLAGKLESDGYVAIRGIGWPSNRDELEVGSLGMKLKLSGGRLEGLREGKPPATLGRVPQELLAIFVVPDAKRLAIFTKPSSGGMVQEFHVLKLP